MAHFTFPALQEHGVDEIGVFDSAGEFADACRYHYYGNGSIWYGGETRDEVIRKCHDGDEELVPLSDKFLESFSNDIAHDTSKFRMVGDLTQGALDIGAYCADTPTMFRARKRVINEQAPLTIVCDLTLSGGLSTSTMAKRGAVILALVRMLSSIRPVSLYVGTALGSGKVKSSAVIWRVETTPINLSVAAHLFSHPGVTRMLGYGYCDGHGSNGGWPYRDEDFLRVKYQAYWGRVLPMNEVFYIPSMFIDDPMVNNPVKWLTDTLERFGGQGG